MPAADDLNASAEVGLPSLSKISMSPTPTLGGSSKNSMGPNPTSRLGALHAPAGFEAFLLEVFFLFTVFPLSPSESASFTGSFDTYAYRLASPPTKPIGSFAVHRPVS